MKSHKSYYKPGFVFFLFSSLIVISSSQVDDELDFNYDKRSGRGPSRWGRLKPEWRNCSVGREQSPINIGKVQIRPELGDLRRNYRSAPAVLKNETITVQVEWEGNPGRININGTDYNVVNIHWHTPSEHTFNGTRYELETHIVHASAENKLAVVSMVYRLGMPDPFLTRLLPYIRRVGVEKIPVGRVNPKSIGFNNRRRYYQYMGSIPIPPCTQGVVWIVFQKVRMASRRQVEALRSVLSPENRNNSRPIQRLNRRPVFLYDPARSGVCT